MYIVSVVHQLPGTKKMQLYFSILLSTLQMPEDVVLLSGVILIIEDVSVEFHSHPSFPFALPIQNSIPALPLSTQDQPKGSSPFLVSSTGLCLCGALFQIELILFLLPM